MAHAVLHKCPAQRTAQVSSISIRIQVRAGGGRIEDIKITKEQKDFAVTEPQSRLSMTRNVFLDSTMRGVAHRWPTALPVAERAYRHQAY